MLIEREGPLAVLAEAAGAGVGSVVLLTGEAGMGKTSVVETFVEQIADRLTVYVGACDDLLVPPALGPVREALRGVSGPVATALAGPSTEPVFEALAGHFEAPRLQVLVVEDVHWADDATLDVLRYLTRRLDRLRLLLVLTYRPDLVDSRPGLRSLLADLRGRPTHRVSLEPLSPKAIRRLAADSSYDVDELHTLTRGNPFFLTEILDDQGTGIPPTVVDAVLARVAHLSESCRRMVEQLSVVPSHLDLDQARRMLGESLEDLAEAERHGVLVLAADEIGFRHEIVRRAIESTLPVLRRRLLHEPVISALLAEPVPELSRVVHHASEARDIATLVRFAPAAGREAAAAGAHQQAVAAFETVMPYADQLPLAERAELLDDYAWELHIAHRFFEAVQVGTEAITLREQIGAPVSLAETLVRVSRSQYLAGDTSDALAAISRAEDLAAGSPAALASVLAYRGMMVTLTRQGSAVEELQRARGLAIDAGRTDLASLCLNYLGMTQAYAGQAGGLAKIEESLAAALGSGDHESAARAYTSLAAVLFREGQFEQLTTCLEAGLSFVREHGIWAHRYDLEVHQACLDLRRGDWAAAEQGLQRLLDSTDDPGMYAVYSAPVLGRLLARRGEQAAAESVFEESWRRAWDQESLIGVLFTGLLGAELAALTGNRDLARSLHAAAMERPIPPGLGCVMGELFFYLHCAGVEVAPFEGCAEVYAAALTGDWTRAVALTHDPYERALFQGRSGNTEATIAAVRTLDELGAKPAAELTRARLAELGVQRLPRRADATTRSNAAGLTARQLEVLRLLVENRTTSEIAAELFLSPRTVDHHVAAIMAKLDVPTRKQAAAIAQAQNLV